MVKSREGWRAVEFWGKLISEGGNMAMNTENIMDEDKKTPKPSPIGFGLGVILAIAFVVGLSYIGLGLILAGALGGGLGMGLGMLIGQMISRDRRTEG